MENHQTTPLRDRIAEALVSWTYRGKDPEYGGILETVRANAYSRADAVLAVLPAPADHDTDDVVARTLASLEKVTERARRAEAEVKRLRSMYDAATARENELIEERDQLRETRTDRAAILREIADEIAGIDFHPNARARSLDIAAGFARRLRRMADETATTETQANGAQRLCGKTRGVSGLYYRPCARTAGHKEAYCRSADGGHLFLAAPPMDPVHILGIDADDEPAAEARQDEPDHVCNTVQARGEMDEPLGYLICGICGTPKNGAQP